MLTRINIGTRMALAFACLVLLSLGLAGSGYWGLSNVTNTAETILSIDVVAAETSGEVQATTLNLRRFEKDFFLNVNDNVKRAEYLAKWKAKYQETLDLLEKLHALVRTDAEREKVGAMRGALAGYDEGFEKIRERIERGELTDPTLCNHQIEPFKDHIRALEANAAIFRSENLHGVREEMLRQSSRSTTLMTVFVGLATVLSIALSIVITRSVCWK